MNSEFRNRLLLIAGGVLFLWVLLQDHTVTGPLASAYDSVSWHLYGWITSIGGGRA